MTIRPAQPRTVYEAVDQKQVGLLYDLLEANAAPDESGPDGKTPLILACERDDGPSIIQLLRFGADPNLAMKDGSTAMHAAAKACSTTGMFLRLIIAEGSMLRRDAQGRRPADFAMENPARGVSDLVVEFTEKELNAVARHSTELSQNLRVSKPIGYKR